MTGNGASLLFQKKFVELSIGRPGISLSTAKVQRVTALTELGSTDRPPFERMFFGHLTNSKNSIPFEGQLTVFQRILAVCSKNP
jgi:hypothetical protein